MAIIEVEMTPISKNNIIFLIIWFIIGSNFIYFVGGSYLKDVRLKKELTQMSYAKTTKDFINLVGQNKSCYGVFTLSSKSPISNSQYSVPQCLDYEVWKETTTHNRKGGTHTTSTTLAEGRCSNLYINNTQININNVFSNLWYNSIEVYDNSRGSYKMTYTPNNIQCILAYSYKEECFLIFDRVNILPADQYPANRYLSIVIIVTIIVILPIIIISLYTLKSSKVSDRE